MKELRDANLKRQSVLRQFKKNIDGVEAYATEKLNNTPKLVERGFPEAMKEFFKFKAEELQKQASDSNSHYGIYVLKSCEANVLNIESVRAESREIEKLSAAVSTAKASFNKKMAAPSRCLSSER